MIGSLLSARNVAEIRRLQCLNWGAARAIAAPTVDVVLTRPGVGTLPPQAVAAIWAKGQSGRHHVGIGADDSPDTDVTLYRFAADGFDVAEGDIFTLDGESAAVTRVLRHRGKIAAQCRLVTGTVWP